MDGLEVNHDKEKPDKGTLEELEKGEVSGSGDLDHAQHLLRRKTLWKLDTRSVFDDRLARHLG